MRLNLKYKFVAVMTVLMALVLSIQYYFMQQTRSGVKTEFQEISRSINSANDVLFLRETLPGRKADSLRKEIELKVKQEKHTGQIEKRIIASIKAETGKGKESEPDKPVWQIKYQENGRDTLQTLYEHLEIDLNRLRPESPNSGLSVDQPVQKSTGNASELIIEVPDYRQKPKARLITYRYSTESLDSSLEKLNFRNLLLTMGLFILSVLVILFITHRFLQPVYAIKHSFTEVVEGNLGVRLPAAAADEMGELTQAFNQMVDELDKNRAKEQLMQRHERLASLGQLAAGVAHEIKNPLNAINLTIGHLSDKYISKENEQARSYILTIQQEIRRLDKLVNNFLSWVRSDKPDRQPLGIARLWEEILSLYQREIQNQQIIVRNELPHDWELLLDSGQIKTAFTNILINAIQAMPAGGNLTLSAPAGSGILNITDTGQGIAQKDIEHIFDLFYTTKSSGTGLGLPTAYKIIKAHQGDIRITSRPGYGTTVSIIFREGMN